MLATKWHHLLSRPAGDPQSPLTPVPALRQLGPIRPLIRSIHHMLKHINKEVEIELYKSMKTDNGAQKLRAFKNPNCLMVKAEKIPVGALRLVPATQSVTRVKVDSGMHLGSYKIAGEDKDVYLTKDITFATEQKPVSFTPLFWFVETTKEADAWGWMGGVGWWGVVAGANTHRGWSLGLGMGGVGWWGNAGRKLKLERIIAHVM